MRRDVSRDVVFREDVDHIALHRCFRDLVTCLDLAPVVQVSRAVGIYEDPEPGVGLVLQGEHLSSEALEEVIYPNLFLPSGLDISSIPLMKFSMAAGLPEE